MKKNSNILMHPRQIVSRFLNKVHLWGYLKEKLKSNGDNNLRHTIFV